MRRESEKRLALGSVRGFNQRRNYKGTEMNKDKKTWDEALSDEKALELDNLPTMQYLPDNPDDWDPEDWDFLIRRNDYK